MPSAAPHIIAQQAEHFAQQQFQQQELQQHQDQEEQPIDQEELQQQHQDQEEQPITLQQRDPELFEEIDKVLTKFLRYTWPESIPDDPNKLPLLMKNLMLWHRFQQYEPDDIEEVALEAFDYNKGCLRYVPNYQFGADGLVNDLEISLSAPCQRNRYGRGRSRSRRRASR